MSHSNTEVHCFLSDRAAKHGKKYLDGYNNAEQPIKGSGLRLLNEKKHWCDTRSEKLWTAHRPSRGSGWGLLKKKERSAATPGRKKSMLHSVKIDSFRDPEIL